MSAKPTSVESTAGRPLSVFLSHSLVFPRQAVTERLEISVSTPSSSHSDAANNPLGQALISLADKQLTEKPRNPSLLNMKVHELARWTRFAAKGGIGKCTAVHDCVAQSSDDLMFLKVCSLALVASGVQISKPPVMYRTTRLLFSCNCKSSPIHIWSVFMSAARCFHLYPKWTVGLL